MTWTPCYHFRADDRRCVLGKSWPRDCGGCAAYEPGLARDDQAKLETWIDGHLDAEDSK
jgi:hypothetical protein